jgi:hypothetical protein
MRVQRRALEEHRPRPRRQPRQQDLERVAGPQRPDAAANLTDYGVRRRGPRAPPSLATIGRNATLHTLMPSGRPHCSKHFNDEREYGLDPEAAALLRALRS